MTYQQKYFGTKYGNEKIITNKKWINIETELRMIEEGPKVEINLDALDTTLKKYQTEKPQA